MGLRQQEKCHIRFPIGPGDVYAFCFSSETYYCFTQQGRQRVGGNEVTVRVEVYTSEKTPLPKPGRRCRDVLICQPPIRALNVYTRCCAPQWPYRTSNGPSETIERENGVRFGDLLDAYLRIAEAHRLCPDADPELHDENGFVKPRISFEANVVALDDDPKLLDRQRYEKKRKTEEERWRASEVRMGPYIAAKRLGELLSTSGLQHARIYTRPVMSRERDACVEEYTADTCCSERQRTAYPNARRVRKGERRSGE